MKNKIISILKDKRFIFFVAFLAIFITVLPFSDLYGNSGDAVETWKVVKSFFGSPHEYSYVMYKGVYAFIPGVISYYGGGLLHIDQFLILKIINALSFAYISVIGIPYLVKNLLGIKELKAYQYYLFLVFFYILESSVFCFISVDYCSAIFFILLCNRIIKFNNDRSRKNTVLLGLLIGLNLSLSGQFSLGAYLILLYLILNIIFKNRVKKKFEFKKILISIAIVLVGMGAAIIPNKIYEKQVVDYGRKTGNWIPAGSDWINLNMTKSMLSINYPRSLPDNIGLSIMQKRGDDIEAARKDVVLYSYGDYMKIALRYPGEFVTRVYERIFLGVVNDYKNTLFVPVKVGGVKFNLFFMLTFIYICLLLIKDRVHKVKDLLNYKTILVISSILTIIPPSLMHVENRYYLFLRTLIMCCAIFGFSYKFDFKKLKNIKKLKINYNIVCYVIFIILCVSFYLAIYQSTSDAALLE